MMPTAAPMLQLEQLTFTSLIDSGIPITFGASFCLPYCHQFVWRGVNAWGMTSRYTEEIKEFRSQLSKSVILMRRRAGSSVFLAKRINVELKTFSCNCFDGWMMDNVEWFCLFASYVCLIHCCNNREGMRRRWFICTRDVAASKQSPFGFV